MNGSMEIRTVDEPIREVSGRLFKDSKRRGMRNER